MVYFVVSDSTKEDQRLYTQARLQEVACQDCLAKVQVKKNSEHHTSIQWTFESVDQCAEFNKARQEPGGRRIYATCSRLRASIEKAVDKGEIEIGAIDGY
ncbi:MAG TPA: hypothetical protein PKX56_00825 [Marmoricola sp.]|nr:hypothetical protein [Marmoricola sp.]HNI70708.1 hypothetical protein [Marmoricola sp.]HNJ77869.1 hypothetical protein [Marmoricola sp.]HNN48553.1 hypothetical protein [Marmoricola sp.]HNO39926.1 hypothetical protein [Marmoricola sp.]